MNRRRQFEQTEERRRPRRQAPGLTAWGLRRLGSFLLASLVLVALVLGLVHHRLRQGPIDLGPLAEIAADRLSAGAEGLEFGIGGAVFALGDPGLPSGIRLLDVEVRDDAGEVLASAPELSLDFHLLDLLRGRVAPTRIALTGATTEIRRDAEGRLRLGPDGGDAAAPGAGGFLALLAAAQSGEGPLRRLERVAARSAQVTLKDAVTGRDWRLRDASFSVEREATRDVGRLSGYVDLEPGQAAQVSLEGERTRGGEVTLGLSFSGLPLSELSAAPPLAPLAGSNSRAKGSAEARIDAEGRVSALDATLLLGPGTVTPMPEPYDEISGAEAKLSWRASEGTLEIRRLALWGAALGADLHGKAEPWGIPPGGGAPAGVALALDVENLEIAGGVSEPVRFDRGRLEADFLPGPRRAEVSVLRFASPEVELSARGFAQMTEEGLETSLTFETGPFDVGFLTRAWPLPVAENARIWVEAHVDEGVVPRAEGAFWAAPGALPDLTIDFDVAQARARPIPGMPPIEGAAATARLTLGRFDMALAEGTVTPPGAAEIDLGGSEVAIPHLGGDPPIALIDLHARGPAQAALALLDQPPLELMSKLGTDLGPVEGAANVTAQVTLPLSATIRMEDVDIASRATVEDVALVAPGAGLPVRAQALEIEASKQEVQVSGDAVVDGLPARISWTERFGASGEPGRDLSADVRLDGEALRRLGLRDVLLTGGEVQAQLDLGGAGGAFSVDADLRDAALALPLLGWSKRRGEPGRLTARGARSPDGVLRIDALSLDSAGLEAQGAATIAAGGGLRRLALSDLRLADTLDVSAEVTRAADGGYEVQVGGRLIDLSALLRRREAMPGEDGGGEAPPIRATLSVGTLSLLDDIALTGASGEFTREGGATRASVTGRANGGTPARIRYRERPGEPATLSLRSDDAGALLADLGLNESAVGGTLRVRARLLPGGFALAGRAAIENIRIGGSRPLDPVIRRAIRDGVVDGADAAGGYHFDRVEAPFRLEGGRLTVDEAMAVGPVLGVKVDGTYDTGSGALDLSGVLTPAYAINGLLNRIPIIGELLGGEGEGLIGLTFAVRGTADNPAVTVNPLSALAPGVLRRLFQAPEEPVDPGPPDLFDR